VAVRVTSKPARDLPNVVRADLRALLEHSASQADAVAAVDTLGRYVRHYHALARAVRFQRKQLHENRNWTKSIQKAARRLDQLIAQRTFDAAGRNRIMVTSTNPAVFHAARVQVEIQQLLHAVDNALQQWKLPRGDAGDPALTHLEAAVADVLDRIGIKLKQGNSTLAAVLEFIYVGIGKPAAETRDRNGARRAIKNLVEWRALPPYRRFML
jgi:hypothetical protein